MRVAATSSRQKILTEANELIGEGAGDQVSMRGLAARLGVSRFALLRHFRSAESLVVGVLAEARADLAQLIQSALTEPDSPEEQIRAVIRALLAFAEHHPALAHLCDGFSAIRKRSVRVLLKQIMTMQTGLLGELIREGQRDGLLDESIDANLAAQGLLAAVYGIARQARAFAGDQAPEAQSAAVLEPWLRGARAVRSPGDVPARTAVAATGDAGLVALDVRPMLACGEDPLEAILSAVERVGRSGVLKITAPFRPSPLLVLLERRGHQASVAQYAPETWQVEVVNGGCAEIADLRDLEAPEPLEQVLRVGETLACGGSYMARVPRYPRLLVSALQERGLGCTVVEEPDGSALIRVWRAI